MDTSKRRRGRKRQQRADVEADEFPSYWADYRPNLDQQYYWAKQQVYDQLDEGQQASFEEAWRIFYEHHLQVAHHYYDAGISVAQIVAVPQKEKEKHLPPPPIVHSPPFGAQLQKYWAQRYELFSRFDDGIALDREGWFSVTPEKIAKHIAKRFKESFIIVDGFCGVGGNAIQFALNGAQCVFAIDIDPLKISCARRNAEVYGVSDRIQFIVGDFLALAHSGHLKADSVFLSPPWGGPAYQHKSSGFSLSDIYPIDGKILFESANLISPNIGYFIPRNSLIKEWIQLSKGKCEVEDNYVGRFLKTKTVYYGNLVKQ